MAKFTLTDAFVEINSVDLSDHVLSVTLDHRAELVDATAMGTAGTRERVGGLKDWQVDVEFQQDFAASNVDDTLNGLVGTTFTVDIRPTSAARSTTNPSYTGTGILENYQPVSANAVGDIATTSCTIMAAGALTRATA